MIIKRLIIIVLELLLLWCTVYCQPTDNPYTYWLKLAKRGDSHAQAMVAYHRKEGLGVDKDLDKATEWAMRAAESQDGLAYWLLAQMHIGRKGKMEALESALSCGYPLAAPLFARLYYYGSDYFNIQLDKYKIQLKNYEIKIDKLNTRRNERLNEKAISFFHIAARNGFAEDSAFLGNYYLKKIGDTSQAFEFFNMAAEQGDPESMSIVAYMLYYGIGAKKNQTLAYEWFRESASKGCRFGIEGLADCYRIGSGTAINEEEAFIYYSMLDKPSPKVKYLLANYYLAEEGENGDISKAKSLLWNSSTLGYVYSQALVGVLQYEGVAPFESDISQALPYLLDAYNNADFDELHPLLQQKVFKYLSYYYRYGREVNEDIGLAEELFEKAEAMQAEVDKYDNRFALVGLRSFEEIADSYTPELSPASEIMKQTVFDYPFGENASRGQNKGIVSF